jgi:hypothetical protein
MTALQTSACAELIIEVSEARGFICHSRVLFIVTAVRDQHHFLANLAEDFSTKMGALWFICLILEMFVSKSSLGKSASLFISAMII